MLLIFSSNLLQFLPYFFKQVKYVFFSYSVHFCCWRSTTTCLLGAPLLDDDDDEADDDEADDDDDDDDDAACFFLFRLVLVFLERDDDTCCCACGSAACSPFSNHSKYLSSGSGSVVRFDASLDACTSRQWA